MTRLMWQFLKYRRSFRMTPEHPHIITLQVHRHILNEWHPLNTAHRRVVHRQCLRITLLYCFVTNRAQVHRHILMDGIH